MPCYGEKFGRFHLQQDTQYILTEHLLQQLAVAISACHHTYSEKVQNVAGYESCPSHTVDLNVLVLPVNRGKSRLSGWMVQSAPNLLRA